MSVANLVCFSIIGTADCGRREHFNVLNVNAPEVLALLTEREVASPASTGARQMCAEFHTTARRILRRGPSKLKRRFVARLFYGLVVLINLSGVWLHDEYVFLDELVTQSWKNKKIHSARKQGQGREGTAHSAIVD